jgi:uncharacterized protein involved in exopolysaccharide biosynthesis
MEDRAMRATLNDLLDLIRRRAVLILGIVILGFAASLYFGLGQRPVYESVETLHIAPPRIAPELAATTVTAPLEKQLRPLVRYLLNDQILGEIVTAYDLFSGDDEASGAKKASALRNATAIDWGAVDESGHVQITITTRLDTAEESRLVAQELGHRLIRLSVQGRIAEASATLDFLIEAEQALQADLWTLQARYAAFRRDNIDLLEGGDSLRQSEMEALSNALVEIEREKIELERNIELAGEGRATQAAQDALKQKLMTVMRQRDALERQRATLARDMFVPSGFRAEMRGYEREIDRIREDLATASARRAQAEAGLAIEEQRQSERLVVTEPATLPDKPVIDTRGAVVALGGGVSMILALVIALMLDMRNPVIRSAEQMQRQTGIAPIAVIPFRARPDGHPRARETDTRADNGTRHRP